MQTRVPAYTFSSEMPPVGKKKYYYYFTVIPQLKLVRKKLKMLLCLRVRNL